MMLLWISKFVKNYLAMDGYYVDYNEDYPLEVVEDFSFDKYDGDYYL